MSIAAALGAVAVATAPTYALLSVSPSHVDLTPGAHRVISIDAGSPRGGSIVAHVAGLALDPRGRPRLVAPGDAAPWLRLSASTLRVVHGRARLTVVAHPVARATAGDHTAVILLDATRPGASGLLVRLRVGLVVSVRVPGRIVHRLALGARVTVRPKRRTIEVAVANRGNVTEQIDGSRLRLALVRGGRTVAVLRPSPRDFLPRSRGLVVFAYAQRLRGPCVARVELWQPTALTMRRYRLRL